MEKIISTTPLRYAQNIHEVRSNLWRFNFIALACEYKPLEDGSFTLVVKDYAVIIGEDKSLTFKLITSKTLTYTAAQVEALGFNDKTLAEIPEHLTLKTLEESNARPIYERVEEGEIFPSEWLSYDDWTAQILPTI